MIANQEAASRDEQALPKAGAYRRVLNWPPAARINWLTVSNDGSVTNGRIGSDSDRPQSAARLISVKPALDRGSRVVESGKEIVMRLEQAEAAFEVPGAAQQRVMGLIAEANQHGDELPVDQHKATFAVLAGGQHIDRLQGELAAHPRQTAATLAGFNSRII